MMTIAMARLLVRTTLNRMGRFDPEGAHDLTQAITLLIEDAVERATTDGGGAPGGAAARSTGAGAPGKAGRVGAGLAAEGGE